MAYENTESTLIALADPTRRRVLEALRSGPQPVGTLAAGLPVSRPAVSQHLKILGDAGLVSVHREGTRRIYAIRPEGLLPLRHWLEGFWDDVLTAFATEITRTEDPDHD
jgi:DNA-binding transcriptional ArsR family regulator